MPLLHIATRECAAAEAFFERVMRGRGKSNDTSLPRADLTAFCTWRDVTLDCASQYLRRGLATFN